MSQAENTIAIFLCYGIEVLLVLALLCVGISLAVWVGNRKSRAERLDIWV